MPRNPKTRYKTMKIANIDRENIYIFWTTSGIWMKFSGKMWLMIILKLKKKQVLYVSSKERGTLFRRYIFEKPQSQIETPAAISGLNYKWL